MIYVLRHQESDALTNVLTVHGLHQTKHMATVLERQFQHIPMKGIYTCIPEGYAHVRPVQTASNLCTFLRGNYSTFVHHSIESVVNDLIKITDITGYDMVIVWHHSEIPKLVQAICQRFCVPCPSWTWPPSCYDGIVMIDVFYKTIRFQEDFFEKKLFLISKLFNCLGKT
jgi:hypothetical protein